MKKYLTKEVKIAAVLILISIASFVTGLFLLPDTVAVQISINGSVANQMSRLSGLMLPLIISLLFSVMYALTKTTKMLIAAVIGDALYILLFVFNL